MPPKKGLKRKRLAKATTVEPGLTEEPSPTVEPSTTTTMEPSTTTTVEPGSTEEPSPTVEPSNTTTVEQGSTEEPSPTAIEGEGVEEQQVPGTLSPVLEESYKNEEENSEKNEEEESGEEESEEEDKEEEKEEGNEEGNEEGEESSDDDGSRSLGGESSSDESKEDEIAPENQPENAMEIDEETEAIPPLSMYFPPSEYVKKIRTVKMATFVGSDSETTSSTSRVIDSHLHIWASPQEAATYPYFPGQEPTLIGDVDFLLKNMEEARVDGALIVQPINHKFDHSLVTSVLKKYPSKFVGCCLANPAEDGSGITHLENLVLESNYRAVRFNPYLWPLGQKMTNPVGKALFSKAGELGVPVGFMCMKNSGGSMMSFILIDDIAPSVLRKRELCGTQTIVAHLLKHSHSDTAKGQDERMALEIAPGRHQIISRTEGCFTTIHCFNQNHRNVILSKETVPHCDHEANVGCLI